MTNEELFAAVRKRIVDPKLRIDISTMRTPRLYGPATSEALEAAGEKLGFALPLLLRRIYSEVENGGFGPGAGLIGVDGGHTNVDGQSLSAAYINFRAHEWPEGLLPVCDLGDGAWSCLDCRTPDARVVTMDESGPTRSGFTLFSWLEAWVSGVDLVSETFEIEERLITNPFTKEPMTVKRRGPPKREPS
jgi:hypothetical protein